ncbi:ABC transporter ATP-binding protein [Leeia sp.]|uniref:ABC transporter ATP-binding protein n=1 Tax=Leeia sp. TaxID=2884678 RepID=UPI0035B1B02B
MSLLEIKNLSVEFGPVGKAFAAVSGMDLSVDAGELVGIVGESGSGKSVTMLAMMGLIDAPGRVTADKLMFDGQDMLKMTPRQRRKIIGKDISMIFQDPGTSLNPSYTVGHQIIETLKEHQPASRSAMKDRALELLSLVEIPDPASRLTAYPHQLSGGMAQRVMIAMALACNPKLLIADEPTTALDVTIQAQVLELLVRLQKQNNMGLILITHDLAVVAETAQRVAVMYAGQVVETAGVPAIFEAPHHPYTQALLDSIPEHSKGAARLPTLPGVVPGAYDRPQGCLLSPRCKFATDRCRKERPQLTPVNGGAARCFFPLNLAETRADQPGVPA